MASLIKKISEINAVCGDESAIREFILDKINADEVMVDTMGNIIALKKGNGGGKIMIAANMDESGFIVSGVTDKGYIKFKPAGNIDINTVISKKVVIGRDRVKGIIGMKAIHLQTKEERENTVPAKKLFIDIGALSKESALKKVKIGDYITFDTECGISNGIIKGKALTRSGICALLGSMEKTCGADLYFVFTAQKEVGMRGAEIIARRIEPDAVITVGAASAEDMYGADEKSVCLGGGVVIPAMDKYAVYDRRMLAAVTELASKLGVPYQQAVLKNEFTDAGAVQNGAGGARCISLSIPCRYAQTPVGMISEKDLTAAELLLGMIIENIEKLIEGDIDGAVK